MKAKLTVTIDEHLVPVAKRYAHRRGVSLSALIEEALRDATAGEDARPFSQRWRGTMSLADLNDERYEALDAKYQ